MCYIISVERMTITLVKENKMKRNFLTLTETEFNTIKAECKALANAKKEITLSSYGTEFDGLSEDAEWQIRYHFRHKFDGTASFNSVARFFSRASYSSYIKKVA